MAQSTGTLEIKKNQGLGIQTRAKKTKELEEICLDKESIEAELLESLEEKPANQEDILRAILQQNQEMIAQLMVANESSRGSSHNRMAASNVNKLFKLEKLSDPRKVTQKEFHTWKNQALLFWKLNGLSDNLGLAESKALLLSYIHQEWLPFIEDEGLLEDMSLAGYHDILNAIGKFIESKNSHLVQQSELLNKAQGKNENARDFLMSLKSSLYFSNWSKTTAEEIMPALFLKGLRDKNVSRRLIEHPKPMSWENMIEITKDCATYETQEKQESVEAISSTDTKECLSCPFKHAKENCPAKNLVCYYCGKKGHVMAKCQNKKMGRRYNVSSIDEKVKKRRNLLCCK